MKAKQQTILKKNAVPSIFEANSTRIVRNNSDGKCVPGAPNEDLSEKREVSNACNAESTQGAEKHSNGNSDNPCTRCSDSSERYDILKAEYSNLRQMYIELETKKCLEVTNLENEIRKLKVDAEIQKKHIKYLSGRVYRKEKSEKSLQVLLKDLEAQSVLSTEAYEVLEVI